MTQKYPNAYAIAKHLGLKPQSVYNWYNGKTHPSTKNLIRLAKLLDMTVDSVLEHLQHNK